MIDSFLCVLSMQFSVTVYMNVTFLVDMYDKLLSVVILAGTKYKYHMGYNACTLCLHSVIPFPNAKFQTLPNLNLYQITKFWTGPKY